MLSKTWEIIKKVFVGIGLFIAGFFIIRRGMGTEKVQDVLLREKADRKLQRDLDNVEEDYKSKKKKVEEERKKKLKKSKQNPKKVKESLKKKPKKSPTSLRKPLKKNSR